MFIDRIPVRLRLSLAHALWLILLFSVLGWGVYHLVRRNLYESLDAALISSAQSIRDTRSVKGFGSPLMREFLEEFLGERFIRSYAQLVDVSGRISLQAAADLRASLPVTPLAVKRAEQGLETFETFRNVAKVPLRQITLPVMTGRRFSGELIQIAAPLDSLHQTLYSISTMLWLAMPTGVIFSILLGYSLTARSLKPVRLVGSAASKLSADDLSQRLNLPMANDEIRKLTQTFNEMLDRLEDAFARLRRFSGDVSHELRTPLTVVRAEAEFALRKTRSAEEYQQALENIVGESIHMTGIVEELLLLARASGRSIKLDFETIELSAYFRDILDSLEAIASQKRIRLKMHCPSNLNVQASRTYLEMIIRNLILNAIKYSPPGAEVQCLVERQEELTEIKITDFGEGIPKEAIPYIFDPFYRVDSARNRTKGGSGIGLSLAQALAKLHLGEIKVHSIEGMGSSFSLFLPQRRITDNQSAIESIASNQKLHFRVKRTHFRKSKNAQSALGRDS